MWFHAVKDAMEKHLPNSELYEDYTVDGLNDGEEMLFLMEEMDLKFGWDETIGGVQITMLFNDEKDLAEKVGVILPSEWSSDGLPDYREGWGVFQIVSLDKEVKAHVVDYLIDDGTTAFAYHVTITVSEDDIDPVIDQIHASLYNSP